MLDAGMTTQFRVVPHCGAIYLSLEQLAVIDTETFVFIGIATQSATLTSYVLSLSSGPVDRQYLSQRLRCFYIHPERLKVSFSLIYLRL